MIDQFVNKFVNKNYRYSTWTWSDEKIRHRTFV